MISGLQRLLPTSLFWRLLLGSALATLLALLLVLLLTHQVLTRFVTGQIDQRLDNKIVALVSQVRVAPDGLVSLDGQADGPPFDKRHHSSFWLVEGPRNVVMTSWLAPSDIVRPTAAEFDGAAHPPPLGPGGLADHPRTILKSGLGGIALHERVFRTTKDGVAITILVAAPVAAIAGPIGEAMVTVALGTSVLGVALGGLAFAQVRLGLRPLARLRQEVVEVGDGRRDSLPLAQPREMAPLVLEMNRLIERNAVNLDKARRHVANLAHGIKTPLATLQLSVERLDGADAAEMRLLLAQIDLRVRHHLGRARAAALAGPDRSRTPLAPRLADLGTALGRIYADRKLALALDCPADIMLACDGNDVDEIFGNLMDNAYKFARSHVACHVASQGRSAVVRIADDGPGLSAADVDLVLRPGRRLDEQMPGFGFGLTIVRELVEMYGGELTIDPRPDGLITAVALPIAGST